MTDRLSVCFVGLGSIGKRHLENLHVVARRRGLDIAVDALRHERALPLDKRTASLLHAQYRRLDDLVHYDLMFVCNPSQLHYETLRRFRGKADYFFVEKPVFVKPVSDDQLEQIGDGAHYYVACPMRHTRVFAFLKQFVSEHRVFSARAICSSYLPDWRPNQDYRKIYSAKKESGGVKLDLIHEFDYLFTLLGFPLNSFLLEGKFSDLKIASNDTVAYIGKYLDKVLELHLDYHGRCPQRYVELNTTEDVVCCDFLKAEVRFLKSGEIISLAEERNDWCCRELEYFLDFAIGRIANMNTLRYANDVLRELFCNAAT